MPSVAELAERLRVFRIEDVEMADGRFLRIVEYPSTVLVRDGTADMKHVNPEIGGTILGWDDDGIPVAAAYARDAERVPDAALLVDAIRQPYGRNLAARGEKDTYNMLFRPLDDVAVRSAAVDWLVRETGCAAADAEAAADLRYDGFADFAGFRDILVRAVPEFGTKWQLDATQWRNLAGPDHAGSWVLDLARRWPAFALSIANVVSPEGRGWRDTAAASPAAVVARLAFMFRLDGDPVRRDEEPTAVEVALAARMEGLEGFAAEGGGLEPGAWKMFWTMRELPRDWWPKSPEQWRAAGAAVRLVSRIKLATGLPVRQICAPCAGRWEEWTSRLAAIAGDIRGSDAYRLDVLGYELFDTVKAFMDQVAWPVGVRVGAFRAPSGIAHLDGRDSLTAARALFGDASAAGILETSMKWHARRAVIDAGIARLSPAQAARSVWPAAIPEFRHKASDGTDVVFVHLTSAAALVAEGGYGPDADGIAGLDHCVGSGFYATACRAGQTRIVSVRHFGADGRRIRSSTVEFSFAGDGGRVAMALRQHRGRRDDVPCEADREAVAAYLDAVGRSLPPVDVEQLAPIPGGDDLEDICGYDCWDDAVLDGVLALWAPLLRRPLRGLSFRAFAAAVGLKERVVELPPSAYEPYDERWRDDLHGYYAGPDYAEDGEEAWDGLQPEDGASERPSGGLLANLAAVFHRLGRRNRPHAS